MDTLEQTEWTQAEAADELGVSVSTVKNWLSRLPQIPRVLRESDSSRILDSRAIALLRVYKAMRDTDRSTESIRVAIDRMQPPGGQEGPLSEHVAPSPHPATETASTDLSAVAEVVAAVLREEREALENGLSDRLIALEKRLARTEAEAQQYRERCTQAEAEAQQIRERSARTEAEAQQYRERFEEARDRANQLEHQRLQLNQSMMALAREVTEQRTALAELSLPAPAERLNPRPWWRFWGR